MGIFSHTIFLLWQIQWALRLFDGARFDGMGINHHSANIGVSQQFLNGADGVIGPLAVALFLIFVCQFLQKGRIGFF
jgi:hypothetical protein